MLKSQVFEICLADKQSIVLPQKHIKEFIKIGHKRVKVFATFKEKSIAFYAALRHHKTKGYTMYFSKAKQKQLDIFINDYFTIQLTEDNSKYGVDMCEELEAVLLSDYDAYSIFENLTPGRQRSIIYTISRYKSLQLRVDKAILLTENLKRGVTDPKLWLKAN